MAEQETHNLLVASSTLARPNTVRSDLKVTGKVDFNEVL